MSDLRWTRANAPERKIGRTERKQPEDEADDDREVRQRVQYDCHACKRLAKPL